MRGVVFGLERDQPGQVLRGDLIEKRNANQRMIPAACPRKEQGRRHGLAFDLPLKRQDGGRAAEFAQAALCGQVVRETGGQTCTRLQYQRGKDEVTTVGQARQRPSFAINPVLALNGWRQLFHQKVEVLRCAWHEEVGAQAVPPTPTNTAWVPRRCMTSLNVSKRERWPLRTEQLLRSAITGKTVVLVAYDSARKPGWGTCCHWKPT